MYRRVQLEPLTLQQSICLSKSGVFMDVLLKSQEVVSRAIAVPGTVEIQSLESEEVEVTMATIRSGDKPSWRAEVASSL